MTPADRLIVALDHPSLELALRQVDRLGSVVERYKVGLELYLAEGARALDELAARQKRVFLDLKLHDIPETVGRAAQVMTAARKVDLLTVHASGGRAMLERAAQAAHAHGGRVLAVTVLTSLDQADLAEDGNPLAVADLVVRRAKLAQAAGCDGVVASPHEAAAIRAAVGPGFLIVTPGVRPADAARADDQKRVATARAAVAAGADAVVVGRPIRDAQDPVAVAQSLLVELGS